MRPRHRNAPRTAVDVHRYRYLVVLLGDVPQQVFRGAELLLSEQFVLRDEMIQDGGEARAGDHSVGDGDVP
jgi:hypothetical protein